MNSKMAKVMVSMPEELLAEVDAEAERLGSTRSAVLRGYAEAAIQRRRTARAEAIAELLGEGTISHGGDVARMIKEGRPQR
jgi:metal-responsive CopG/Arc/MetJ family transcriptional regulator